MFEWNLGSAAENDLIEINKKVILKQLRDALIIKYNLEIKHVINYYKYYKNKKESTQEIIKHVIKEKNYIDNEIPPFVLEFFKSLKPVENIIEKIDNEELDEYLTDIIKKTIVLSVDKYLDM
jgi:hypothetical protein